MNRTIGAAALALVLLARAPFALASTPAQSTLTGLDIIELEIAWTTLMSQYYRPLTGVQLLEGARSGLIAYLKTRGVKNPVIPSAPANIDRWQAEDRVVSDVVFAVRHYQKAIRSTDLIDAAVAGELASTHDPYTVLFKPEAYHSFVKSLDGSKFGGIGVQLALDGAGGAVRIAKSSPRVRPRKRGSTREI